MEAINEMFMKKNEAGLIHTVNHNINNPNVVNTILMACFFRLHDINLFNKIVNIIKQSNNAESIQILRNFIVPTERKYNVNPWDIDRLGMNLQKYKCPFLYSACRTYSETNSRDIFDKMTSEYNENNLIDNSISKTLIANLGIDMPFLLNIIIDYNCVPLLKHLILNDAYFKEETIRLFVKEDRIIFNTFHIENSECIHLIEALDPDILKSKSYIMSLYYSAITGIDINLMEYVEAKSEFDEFIKLRFPKNIFSYYRMAEDAFNYLRDQ